MQNEHPSAVESATFPINGVNKKEESCHTQNSSHHYHCILLFKILHTALKDLHILLAVDINCDCIAAALGMSHLAEYTAVGACDTLDRHIGAVDIPLLIHRRLAGLIHILCHNLSVLKQPIQPLLRCNETSLSM